MSPATYPLTRPCQERTTKPRLLAVGEAVVSSGFARVLHSLLGRLQAHYEIHQLGLCYQGDPHPYPWNIYPARTGGDFYGVGRIRQLIERVRPNLVLIINDLGPLGDYMEALRSEQDNLKIVLYCPIDSGPIDPSAVARLTGAHRLVAYTQFGKRELEKAMAIAYQQDPTLRLPPVEVMAHGVDTQLFAQSDRLWAKQTLWPSLTDNAGSFVVLNANRNQPRKRIDLTMQGFALFAKDKPAHVRLYLHMGVEDLGWNVLNLAVRLGIEQRLILTSTANSVPMLSDAQMNLIYNACDVGLNTSTGEGWGLVSFEHAATGAAQVMTGHEVACELWQGAAELIEPFLTLTEPKTLTRMHLVRPEDVAAALERLYQDSRHLQTMAQAAYQKATNPAYSWDQVAQHWDRLFTKILTEPSGMNSVNHSDPIHLTSQENMPHGYPQKI
ncbi:glycosyltransferase family 4 protein [Anthocerotibacter panamensis]|uniref:glycosyltransferase family 4 protein n=1 Tax=Anthocerotibacter panamensis TaxID=2857077 RepID=UPI001C4077BB|nr:glycosyltransferase [Anthocerotibacter panamensis]